MNLANGIWEAVKGKLHQFGEAINQAHIRELEGQYIAAKKSGVIVLQHTSPVDDNGSEPAHFILRKHDPDGFAAHLANITMALENAGGDVSALDREIAQRSEAVHPVSSTEGPLDGVINE